MKRLVSLITTLALGATLTFAASAESLYKDFSAAVDANDLDSAIEKYTLLEKQKTSEAEGANKQIEKAVKKNNAALYREAAEDLRVLSSYRITRSQSDALLSLILAEEESLQAEDAAWLYNNSYTYSPSLTYQIGTDSENCSMRFTQSLSTTPGTDITLPSAEDLKVDARRFGRLAGWGLTPDRIDYRAGETIKMPLSDTTLYAQWQSAVSFTDERSSTNTVIEVQEGEVITVPVPTREDGAIFAGWFDSTNGEYIPASTTEYTVTGKGACFEALWTNLVVQEMSSGNYSPDKVPVNTQIPLSFTISNTGSEDIRDLSIKVSSESELLTLMNTEAYSRGISAGKNVRLTGVKAVIDKSAASGTELPVKVTITDKDGNNYTSTFNLIVK